MEPARLRPWMAGVIVGLLALAYSNTFSVPFLLDDTWNLAKNQTIRHLLQIRQVLAPPVDAGVRGRPVLNFSFALCYAAGGSNVVAYHVVNLLVHVLACLSVFGIARRTLLAPAVAGRFRPHADAISLMIALIWGLHPLQTESVTYLSQRAEELMGLFFLQTLYCFIRSAAQTGRARIVWAALSALCCLAGMATKEVMVTAPLIVLLYDAVFVGGSLREAWRRRWPLHVSLMASWALLAWLMRGISELPVGYGRGESLWATALTECRAIVEYLGLSVWPHPLVLFRDPTFVHDAGSVVLQGTLLLALLGLTLAAMIRKPAVGFACAWIFLILAPTSSVVPILKQPVAEHRMYLPLAGVAALFVAGLVSLGGRRALLLAGAVVFAFAGVTWSRNRDYRTELAIWTDAVAKEPGNSPAQEDLAQAYLALGRYRESIGPSMAAIRANPKNEVAHNNLGVALISLGRIPEALVEFAEALRLKPDYAEAHNNTGAALLKSGRFEEAIPHYREALRLSADYADARNDLGIALFSSGRVTEAIAEYERVLGQEPDHPATHARLGTAFFSAGRIREAIGQFDLALKQAPDDPGVLYDMGVALAKDGEVAKAIAAYEKATRLEPGNAEAHINLGCLYSQGGRLPEAVAEFGAAIRSKPDYAEAHDNLGQTLKRMGRTAEAVDEFRIATRLAPDSAPFHFNLANAFLALRAWSDAQAEFLKVVRLDPGHAEARNSLGALYFLAGRLPEAISELSEAVRLKPDYAEAHRNLGVALERVKRKDEAAIQFEIASKLGPPAEKPR